jgi:2,3-bisphosphoglycerate-independent phosphoglycerate mutase
MNKRIVLIILDGWGIGSKDDSNPIYRAKTPTIEYFKKFYPITNLQSAGIAVGLPWGEAGNSEVGHLTIGSGRILYQHLPRITLSIKSRQFFEIPSLLNAFEHAKKTKGKVHILGLCSDGNVHSSYEHLKALIELSSKNKEIETIFHLFTDGKDSPLKSGIEFIKNFLNDLKKFNIGRLGSLVGRYYAMDRRKNWKLIKKYYDFLTKGNGLIEKNPEDFIQRSYSNGITDSHIQPAFISETPDNLPIIQDNDSLIFFNFREDSIRELASSFALKNFNGFEREKILKNIYITTFTEYDDDLDVQVAFPPEKIQIGLSEYLSQNDIKQLKIAETEKFFHLTYFFNGLTDKVFKNEFRILIPSKEVAYVDKFPEMRAEEITNRLITAMNSKVYGFIAVNYANADVIAHTGNYQSTISAIEEIDKRLKMVYEAAKKTETTILITADHGNAEKLYSPISGEKETEHNANPVPLYLIDKEFKRKEERKEEEITEKESEIGGVICDIAPTILELMNLPIPEKMKGKGLLRYLI